MTMAYLVGVLTIVVLGETWLLWRVGRAFNKLDQFAERLAHVTGALNLLTETAESGFTSFAGALTQTMQPPRPVRPRTRRKAAAVTTTTATELPQAVRTPAYDNLANPFRTAKSEQRLEFAEGI